MSSLSDSQECSFPDERKKLDGFRLFDTGNPQRTKDSETNSTFKIRKSLAWDSAFFTSPGVLEPEELLQSMNSQLTGNAINLLGNEEGILLPSESLEPTRTRKLESCSFRKSLAWDSAFYTNPGVLDPEELSIVNRGFKKCDAQKAPWVKKIRRSAESISRIDSGCSSLSSLEFELFEDERSSMRKPASLNLKKGRGLQNGLPTNKTDSSSPMRVKAMSTCQRQSLNLHQTERILKEDFISSRKQLAAGSGKFISSASLKPPKIFSSVDHSSTSTIKRSSLAGNYVKMGTVKAAAGKGESPRMLNRQIYTLSKRPWLWASSPKSSSSGSPAANDTTCKTSINSRRKMDNSLENGLIIGSPLAFTKTNKDEPEMTCEHCCRVLTPKSTSFTSPASSIVGWSCESPSSSVHQKSFSIDICSLDQHSVGLENQDTSVPNKLTKPSGLRVPSPKNGFFDEEIALLRASGSMHVHSGVRNLASQLGAPNRYGKLKPPTNVDGKKNTQTVLKRVVVNKEPNKENDEPPNMCIRQEHSDREDTYHFKNQIEGLSEQVGAINIGRDVVMMELQADKNAFRD